MLEMLREVRPLPLTGNADVSILRDLCNFLLFSAHSSWSPLEFGGSCCAQAVGTPPNAHTCLTLHPLQLPPLCAEVGKCC